MTTTGTTERPRRALLRRPPPRAGQIGAALLAVLAVAATVRYVLVSWRDRIAPDATFPYTNLIMTDFRDAVWLPGAVLSGGGDPYDDAAFLARFPATQGFSPYTPSHLLLSSWAWPFEWATATLVWSAVTGLALAAMGAWTGWAAARLARRGAPVGRTLALAAASAGVIAVWVWRPTTIAHGLGQPSALWGPFAAVAAGATVIAAGLPGWARAALTVGAFAKPQAGLQLMVAVVAARQWRPLLYGLAGTAALSLVVAGTIAGTGTVGWVLGLPAAVAGRHSRYDQNHTDGIPWIDLPATVYRFGLPEWLGPVLVLAVLVAGVWAAMRLRAADRPALGALVAMTAGLLAVPHCAYDLLLLFPVLVLAAVEQVRALGAGGFRVAAWSGLAALVVAGMLPAPLAVLGLRPEGAQAVLCVLAAAVLIGAVLLGAAARRAPAGSTVSAVSTSDGP